MAVEVINKLNQNALSIELDIVYNARIVSARNMFYQSNNVFFYRNQTRKDNINVNFIFDKRSKMENFQSQNYDLKRSMIECWLASISLEFDHVHARENISTYFQMYSF